MNRGEALLLNHYEVAELLEINEYISAAERAFQLQRNSNVPAPGIVCTTTMRLSSLTTPE